MGIYTLDLDDGSQIEVEAPRDTPLRELLTIAAQQRVEASKPALVERQGERQAKIDKRLATEVVGGRDANTAIGRGIGRGIDSLQQNLGSATEGIGSVLGLEGLEKFGSEIALNNEAELQRAERFSTRLSDVDGVGSGLSAAGELVGESAPQMAQVAAGAAAGAAYGGGAGAAFFGIGAAPGAAIGAVVGGALAAIPLFFGGNRERQISAAEGDRTGVNEGAAFLTAVPQALMDSIFTMLGAKYVLGPLAKAAPAGQGLFTRAAKGAGVGAATEIPTEIGQAVLERAQAGLSITSAEALREYGEAGLAAGLLGGGLGGLGGAARRAGVPEAEPEALLQLPAPSAAELGSPVTQTEPLQITDQPPQLQITGPDDLGIQLDAGTGQATTRDQRIETGEQGLAGLVAENEKTKATAKRTTELVEQAKAELQNDGSITPATFRALKDSPINQVKAELENTQYQPLLSLIEGSPVDKRPLGTKPEEFTPPQGVQNKERLAKAVADAKSGLGAVAGKQDTEIKADLAREQTQDTSAKLRRSAADQLDADTDSLIAELDRTGSDTRTQAQTDLQKASALETVEGQRDTGRAKQSEATRTKILQDTVANAGDLKQPAALQRAFESALTAAGIGKATATPAEVASIEKASAIIVAKAPDRVTADMAPAPLPAVVDPRQTAMEAEVAPKPVEPIQQSLPTLGRKRDFGTAPAQETTAETTVEPKIVDAALFDKLGVPPSAPIRKRVMGKDFNDTEVRQQFATLAGNKNTSATVKTKINRELQATSEAQLDLPFAKTRATAKEKKPDVKTAEIKPKTSRDRVPTPKSNVGSKSAAAVPIATTTAKSPKKPTAPRTSGVGSPVVESGSTAGATRTKSDTLERSLSRDATPGKQTAKTPAQPIPAELKEAKAKRVAAEKATTPRESLKFADQKSDAATKARAETVKTKEADAKQEAIFAAQDAVIQRQGNADSDLTAPQAPITASDKNKILKLAESKRTSAPRSRLANAVQKYFNQYPTFTAALDAIIYDVSMQIPTRKKDAIEYKDNADLSQFYTADKDNNLPSMGRDSARKITDWLTSKEANMSVELQKYVTTELQKGSQARVSQANYLAGDRVVKARSKLTPEELADLEVISNEDFNLPAEFAIDTPLRPSVKAAILEGDLTGALNALRFTAGSKDIALLAKRLMENIGNTKLITKKNLKTDDGSTRLAGYFDPETNTIALDEKAGINAHTLLHEMLHAVTSATIANKSHPLTKKLNRIFEGVKEQLAGEYGVTNLDEFVAEAFANPDFQTQLKTTTVNGGNPFLRLVRDIANYVRTFFGRPTVSETSTFDAVDKLVQEIIAPTYDGRAATKIYMEAQTPKGAAGVINNIGTAPNAVKVTTKKAMYDYIQEGRNWMGSKVPLPAKKVWLNLQPVNILTALSESRIPRASELNTIINNMSAALRGRNESLDPIVNDLRAFRKKSPKLYTILQSMVPNASKERIDPREANFEKAYGRKEGEEGYDLVRAREVHKKLRAQYESLAVKNADGTVDATGQKLYKIITNNFEKSLNDVMGAIETNLAATIGDVTARKRARDKLAELLNRERGRIKPFAPLTRFGPHRLEYNALDPETNQPEMFVEYFKTRGQLEKAKVKVLEYNKNSLAKLPANDPRRAYIVDKAGNPVGMHDGKASEVRDFSGAPKTSFVYEVLQILNANGADKATVDRVVNLAIDSMPERSFMQSFQKRKDVRGFLGDVTPTGMAAEAYDLIDMVQTKGRDYNRQLVQMEFGAQLEIFQRDVLGLDAKRTDPTTMLYRDRLDLIVNFAKSPNIPRWSQSLTAAGYAWTMGWNLSSAAITTFDVFMSTAPRLMGRYGDRATFRAMGAATSILAKSPKTKMVAVMDENGNMTKRKVNTGMAGFSIGNYDFSDPDLDPRIKDLEILAEVATENAQINQSLNQEELDMNNAKDVLEKINSFTSFLFHHSERYNREVAMTANYMLEVDRMKAKKGSALTDLEKREAAAVAVKETEFTLGATASAGRPVYSQSSYGNVLMLFKRFAISKYHMMATMTNEAFQAGGDADTVANRKIAQGQLARFLISTGLFAGVAGMPLLGAVGQIYNIFVDDDEDDFDAMLRKTVGEGLYGGAINAALGVDVASRIGMNSLLYRPPIIDKDQSLFYTLIEQFGGPVVGIGLSVERGFKDAAEGEYARAAKAIAPAAVRNVLKGGEQLATGEVRTRRGDAVVEDIGIAQILAQAGGFANADVNRQYDINKNERRKNTYLGKKRTSLLRQANIAAANGDRKAYRDALRDIRKYNSGLPRDARSKNLILPKTIERSRKAFDTRTSKMVGGIEYTPLMRSSLEEYDQGIQLFD